MKEEIQNPYPDNDCFFCGRSNNEGLKLKFYWDKEKEEVYTEYLPAQHFVGQGDILHGAIQMGLLDEIMGWTSYVFTQEMAVTSHLNIDFLHPAYIDGNKLNVTCRITSKKGPKIYMQAILTNSQGTVCTKATGTYHLLHSDKYKDLIYI
ncbi:PaaI family thioesterase [Desulforhopalus vacuolatus]|uniref:PaaI family thioesterase n=1 Tax=Desulforhopalus vacuolatus TaxID=40414 RepID=UPI001964E861|nr:PaaI family thioesterase [Desulforhopalus vacuolatus]MBM9518922.1 PaaI family thioesterase [Desulforhopalus vacuolatus]